MSFEDKRNEYKEKREAKAYFNENNDAIIAAKGYAIAILAGLVTAIIGGYLSQVIANTIGYYSAWIFVIIGFCIGLAMKKVTSVGTLPLGVIAVVIYVVGIVLGIGVNLAFTSDISMSTSINAIVSMITDDIMTMFVVLIGAFGAFKAAGR